MTGQSSKHPSTPNISSQPYGVFLLTSANSLHACNVLLPREGSCTRHSRAIRFTKPLNVAESRWRRISMYILSMDYVRLPTTSRRLSYCSFVRRCYAERESLVLVGLAWGMNSWPRQPCVSHISHTQPHVTHTRDLNIISQRVKCVCVCLLHY